MKFTAATLSLIIASAAAAAKDEQVDMKIVTQGRWIKGQNRLDNIPVRRLTRVEEEVVQSRGLKGSMSGSKKSSSSSSEDLGLQFRLSSALETGTFGLNAGSTVYFSTDKDSAICDLDGTCSGEVTAVISDGTTNKVTGCVEAEIVLGAITAETYTVYCPDLTYTGTFTPEGCVPAANCNAITAALPIITQIPAGATIDTTGLVIASTKPAQLYGTLSCCPIPSLQVESESESSSKKSMSKKSRRL